MTVFDVFAMILWFPLLPALVVDALFGERPIAESWHPAVLTGRLIGFFERHGNRPAWRPWVRRLAGAILVLLLPAALGCAAVWIEDRLMSSLIGTLDLIGHAVLVWLIALFIAQRSLFDHVRAVGRALEEEDLDGGRAAVAQIVGRDVSQLDTAGVTRAAIESLAENASDGVIAPVFWYLVFGLPGLVVYKTVNTLDSMIGHRSARYADFGWAAARLDDLLNLIPARFSALLVALAAPSAHAVWVAAIHAGRHRSPNAGWPEAAFAGALGLKLGGPRVYDGEPPVDAPWIGTGRAEAVPADIGRALSLFVRLCVLNALFAAAVLVVRELV